MRKILLAILSPLKSRKTRTALATVIVAYLAQRELDVPVEIIVTIISVGVALILGIAHEDHARKAASNVLVHQAVTDARQARVNAHNALTIAKLKVPGGKKD